MSCAEDEESDEDEEDEEEDTDEDEEMANISPADLRALAAYSRKHGMPMGDEDDDEVTCCFISSLQSRRTSSILWGGRLQVFMDDLVASMACLQLGRVRTYPSHTEEFSPALLSCSV